MKHHIKTADGFEGILTTEHAASSYGQPVLVVEGQAYGPGELVPLGPPPEGLEWLPHFEVGWMLVRGWLKDNAPTVGKGQAEECPEGCVAEMLIDSPRVQGYGYSRFVRLPEGWTAEDLQVVQDWCWMGCSTVGRRLRELYRA